MTMNAIEVVPSASRLTESLRDIGYEFPTAIADLIDNSISAGATEVHVVMEFRGSESRVRIADNGSGMTSAELTEALRYGSRRDYGEDDLGRFGLGLKTASLSQCEVLTVASRVKGKKIQIRRWDQAHVRAIDRWEITALSLEDTDPGNYAPILHGPGTVVTWEQLGFSDGLKSADGPHARNRFMRLCRDTEEHLSMVFHRFIQDRRLAITLNGNELEPWDPFALTEKHTRAMRRRVFEVECDGKSHRVSVQPYVLPTEAQFSDKRAFSKAGGPGRWAKQQGLYIYRGDRLIQSGGWSRLRTPDEHTKLARIAVQFSPQADRAFRINVAKMNITLPEELFAELKPLADETAKAADLAYRGKDSRTKAKVPAGIQPADVAPPPPAQVATAVPVTSGAPIASRSVDEPVSAAGLPADVGHSPQVRLLDRLSEEFPLDRDVLKKVIELMVELWHDLRSHPLVKEVLDA